MNTIVSAFDNRAAAHAAADRLIADGFAADTVQLHDHASAVRNVAALETDELASGGFFTNLLGLFEQLLGTAPPPGDAGSYAEMVRREGTLLTLHVTVAADAQRARDLLHAAGAKIVSSLPQVGLEA
ncbi:MAG TPA: hypothetical protein VFF72_03100 [Caldimonas sp.]|nr:hypothetical protein [Caldimonas sp.]